MTRRAPGRRVAHFVPPRLSDSLRGIERAADGRFHWIDCNFLISRDDVVFAQHGAPYGLAAQGYLPKGDKRRVRDLDAAHLRLLKTLDGYRLQPASAMFRKAAHEHMCMEFEAKDDKRFTKPETWERLAHDARLAWGKNWPAFVVVKVLTNLSGGLQYALDVCAAAHAAGFPTMILPRGKDRLRRINQPTVTFNRGGRI